MSEEAMIPTRNSCSKLIWEYCRWSFSSAERNWYNGGYHWRGFLTCKLASVPSDGCGESNQVESEAYPQFCASRTSGGAHQLRGGRCWVLLRAGRIVMIFRNLDRIESKDSMRFASFWIRNFNSITSSVGDIFEVDSGGSSGTWLRDSRKSSRTDGPNKEPEGATGSHIICDVCYSVVCSTSWSKRERSRYMMIGPLMPSHLLWMDNISLLRNCFNPYHLPSQDFSNTLVS